MLIQTWGTLCSIRRKWLYLCYFSLAANEGSNEKDAR